jgi:penicillin amidase
MKRTALRRGFVRAGVGALCLLSAVALLSGCKSLFLAKGYPEYRGEVAGLPLQAPVRILRDSYGIPHIYAQNRHDLMVAQGYVHAQDRLWQMETLRRVATGTLSEAAGEARLDLDYFARLLGLPELRRRAAAAMRPEETALLQAYVDGVNAYIRQRGDNLPLEFRSSGIVPAPWQVEDVFSFTTLNSWMFRENYRAELLALTARRNVTLEEWKDIFPGHPGANLPDDTYFEALRSLKIGAVQRAALAFFQALPEALPPAGGTNSWVTARGPGGKPLLANDTHVGIALPGTWYLCGLSAPGVDIAGASAAGVPGVIVGHTDAVAWGIAILPIDFVDLFVVRVDPADPTRYYVGGKTLNMERQDMVFAVKGGKSRTRTAWRTIYGPVITALEPGVEAAAALRWYGSLPEGELVDRTVGTVLGFMDCHSVQDVMKNVECTKIVGLNFVAADVQGNIGWQAAGAVPNRRGYSGRLPADGSSGAMGWEGFLPFDQMPRAYNPPEGFIVNCNQRVVTDADPNPISNSWSAPYRHDRVMSLLQEMKEPSVEGFRNTQMDLYSRQAEALLPKVLSYRFSDPKAVAAAALLKGWDRQVAADSRGAAVYEVFLVELIRALLDDEVGDNLFYYFHVMMSKYLIEDVILDRPDSSVWDRKDTPQKEGPQEILERALVATVDFLDSRLGDNPRKWSWGRLHQVQWRHPGATSGFTRMLLNCGPFPIGGDATTLNAEGAIPAKGEYRSLHLPALRMVVPLNDLDGMQIVATIGQSGQPGQRHYDDMVRPWLKGQLLSLPCSPARVQAGAESELTLTP